MKLKGQKIAVLGYGIEGKDLTKYLLKGQAKISILDQKPLKKSDLLGLPKNVEVITGENYLDKLGEYNTVFRSPGVYRYKKEVVGVEKKGVEISSVTKLFFELCPAKIIGVTGSKGKGTTATLIYQILKQAKKDVYLAGNIGKPVLELLPKLNKASWVVLELSSFQLIDFKRSPHISVVLNITSDHMDWHKDLTEYIESKENIAKHQKKGDLSVVNFDYQTSKKFAELGKGKTYYFSKKSEVEGSFVSKGKLFIKIGKIKQVIGDTESLLLRGRHNWENVTAAICASYLAGAGFSSIKRKVFSFRGLEHRLELVGEVDGVFFYNDSFATGPQPTVAAIESFNEPLTLILGGYDKGHNFKELAKEIKSKKNLSCIMLIGDVAGKIKKTLDRQKYKGKIFSLGKPDMKFIVEAAYKSTPKGGVVLLSPAAASFDMFESYKDRGNQFKKAVKTL